MIVAAQDLPAIGVRFDGSELRVTLEFRNTTPEFTARRATGYSERKQREILGLLGFPATEATVKMFRRIRPEAVNPSVLRLLRGALPLGGRLSKVIAHAETINAGVLAFLAYPDLRERLTAPLLRELAGAPGETATARTADLVFDILRMGEGIPRWAGMPALTSRTQVQEIHESYLLNVRRWPSSEGRADGICRN